MKVSLQIFNPQKTMARILDDKTGIFVAETCAGYFDDFVPMDRGNLSQTYTTEPFKIRYEQLYAIHVYDGDNLNFSTERHLNASSHWDRPAMIAHRGVIAQEITDFIKRR